MNRDEAKKSLRAFRPTEPDHLDPEFTEALKLVQEDPDLARWLAEETAFDAELAEHLADVPIPADLREQILSRRPDAQRAPQGASWRHSLFLFAACLAVLAAVATLWTFQHRPAPLAGWQTGSLAALTQILSGQGKLDKESPNSADLRQWLATVQSPVPHTLPKNLEHLDSAGCKTLVLDNARVSIICFHTSPTQLAHLVTVNAGDLANAPPEHQPQFVRNGEWITASWSDRGQAYMLAMKGGEAELRSLLAG